MIASRRSLSSTLATGLVLLAGAHVDAAIVFEAGDAGSLPVTAQVITGDEAIDSIRGVIRGSDDIDMFAIYIADLSLFSATTVSVNTDVIDSQLFLFDSAGIGIAANGDTDLFGSGETNATIPIGSVTAPAGLYYLAVSLFDDFPVSATGAIFPDLFLNSSSGEVVGPAGPGGANPITGWSVDGFSEPFSAYEILLTGATPAPAHAMVTEPASLIVWCTILLVTPLFRRRRSVLLRR